MPRPRAATPVVLALACLAVVGACGPTDAASPAATPSTTTTRASAPATATPSSATPSATATTTAPPATANATTPAPAPSTPTTSAPAVALTVTFSGWNSLTGALEVGAYVDGVLAGGTCTLRLSGPGGRTASVTTEASPDAATTVCELLSVPGPDLVAGTWTGSVEFGSAERSGRADVAPMEVP